jgi:hypothetical protein
LREKTSVTVKRDGRQLHAGGEVYLEGTIRTFWLDAFHFERVRAFRVFGQSGERERLMSKAALERDRIAVIGSQAVPVKEASLAISPGRENRDPWLAIVGFLPFEHEISEQSEEFFVELEVPSDVFGHLVEDWRAGRMKVLRIGIDAKMFIKSADDNALPTQSVTWFLPPDQNGRVDTPEAVQGTVKDFYWKDS